MTSTALSPVCTCDALADEHCELCRNRHKLVGQAFMPYRKTGTLLSVENVCLDFGGPSILKDVHVKIRKIERDGLRTGRIVAFLGPSGIGKTQTCRILAGLQQPTSGAVFLGTGRWPVHPGLVGMVSQQYILYNNRTILGNLRVAAMRSTMGKSYFERRKIATQRSLDMLKFLDLEDKAGFYPAQLSGGQRQRIAVGQQELCSDHYLVLDEPTAGLDPTSKKHVCDLVTELAATGDGITVIMVTHDIPTAVALSDTIWLMGRDRDANGVIIPGARIVDSYDLIECGLTWNPNNRVHPAYNPLVQELNDRFDTL